MIESDRMLLSLASSDTATPRDWESFIADFEAAWNRGEIPDINCIFQAYAGAEKEELLHELVIVDMEYRWRSSAALSPIKDAIGSTPRLSDYANICEPLGPVERLPADIVAEEYRIQKLYGDFPNWDQFLSQHPNHVSQLISCLDEIDSQLAADSEAWHPTPAKTVIDPDPAAALQYSDYTLQRLIGAGGMGRVYAALRQTDRRLVAVKALRKSLQSNPRAVRQFVQEARLLAQLDHPNIVHVHGLGRFPNGGYFIVMDHVAGENLQLVLNRGPLPVANTIRLVRTVAQAIEQVHELGIVHCDLKPGNVLLGHSGEPIVTDFGFAQLISGRLESERSVGGTLGYIAPEILTDGAEKIGTAVDVYGLGALLIALLTGTPPSCGSDFSMEIRYPELPAQIFHICRRCTDNDPRNRYKNVREFIDALE